MISILILSYNAREYTKHTLKTLRKTKGIDYEVIVLDNASDSKTRRMLVSLQKKGFIDKLIFEKENTFFAKGNNTASKLCDVNSEYILLLNSDVEIRDSFWLQKLLKNHKKGATAYGVVNSIIPRADGYCLLIDKELYEKYKLDESYQWWWSVTKLQGQLLNENYNITAILSHNNMIFHYGGRSGDAWMNASGMQTKQEEVKSWFKHKSATIIESISGEDGEYNKFALVNIRYVLDKIIKKVTNRVFNFAKS
ncbi:glycosyltransferase involved in cell wall biosynthesis [Neobacillus niacini]|uniref:glycosyltransferase family 2 protein n=1 Tax=Neobacillus niacini TaxID=86668 RepID=UPI002781B621|nr:glycosyltransferase [Neobacillus niacini]MDQ1000341.1 glycosyltransferase involved in cell wall biosynthesis [Neobacillus niacini]